MDCFASPNSWSVGPFLAKSAINWNVNVKYSFTRPDSVKEYLTLTFQLMADFAKNGPTDQELGDAKQSMIEEFAYNFESPYSLASYKASLDFNGYPDDYLKNYRGKVKAVTREQATQATQSILLQNDWVLAVCGPPELEKVLSAFGKIYKGGSIFESLDK